MTFTTPCFVWVENPEKRKELIEWLEWIGYKLEYLRNDGVIVLTSENRVYVYGEALYRVIKVDYDTIDCGENTELFKALAAMNYENYREQWFVEEGRMFKCTSDKISNYSYHWLTTRKATAEEIVEYFKNNGK